MPVPAIEKPETNLAVMPSSEITPMGLLQLAIERGSDIGTIERMAVLAEKMQAQVAERQWIAAMQRAQQKMGPVRRNATNPQTHSKYATYDALDAELRPTYTSEGFTICYNTAESPIAEHVRVLADVAHVGGHSRTFQIDMPVDGKGAKGGDVMTKTHAMGSGFSYGKRYLLKGIWNIPERDDDGNGAGGKTPKLAERLVLESLAKIENCRDLVELQRTHKYACQMAQEAGDQGAELQFIKASNERKVAIRAGN